MSARYLWIFCAAILFSAVPAAAGYTVTGPDGDISFDATLRLMTTDQHDVSPLSVVDSDDLYTQVARFGMRGSYLDDLSWRMEWEMRGHEDGNDLNPLDLWFAWSPNPRLQVRFGQMKVPFGRKYLVSTKRLNTASVPDAAGNFVPRRDVGALGSINSACGLYKLSLGVFQGAGVNESADDAKHSKMLAGRLEGTPFGAVPKGEADLKHSPEPRLLLGAGVVWSDDAPGLGITDITGAPLRAIDGERTLFGADASLYWRGIYASAEFSRSSMDWDQDAAIDAGRSYDATGLVLQANYFIRGLNLQPRVMYDSFDPDDGADGDVRKTMTWGLNWLPHGHEFKLMAEYLDRLEMNDYLGDRWSSNEFRLVAQIWVH